MVILVCMSLRKLLLLSRYSYDYSNEEFVVYLLVIMCGHFTQMLLTCYRTTVTQHTL